MAVELKHIAGRFYPAAARFRVICSNNCLSNLTHQFRSFSSCAEHCLIQQSKCFSGHPSNHIQQSKFFSGCTNNVTQQYECISNFPISLVQPEYHASKFQRTPSSLFRQLDPPRSPNQNSSLLHSSTKALEYLRGLPKTFFFRRRKNDEDKKKPKNRIPKLILIQNPFTWFMIKIDFSVLRNIWDPDFHEKEFKYGTKQAISKVTNVISGGRYAELNGLLTKPARLSLMRELDRNWSDKQRSLLALNRDDIQITSPRKVYFIRIADKKYCDVDMAFLALKWAPINSIEALIFTEIFARFHREYTPHSIPEWTIAYFKVTRFEVLRRKPKS